MPDDSTQIVATMAESGAVNVFDTTMHFDSFDTPGLIPPKDPKPIWVADCHKGVEGFAIDWSRQEKVFIDKISHLLTIKGSTFNRRQQRCHLFKQENKRRI